LKERSVWMVAEIRVEHESEWAAMIRVSELLGVGTPETVRKRVRLEQVEAGSQLGITSEESAEVKRLRREVSAGCLLDRLLHHCHTVDTVGGSYRMKQALRF